MSLIINMHFGQINPTEEESTAVLVYNLNPFRHCPDGQCPIWLEESFGHFIQNGITVDDYKGRPKDLHGETISRSLAFVGLIEQIKLLKVTSKMISDSVDEDSVIVLNIAKSGVLGKYLLRFIAGLVGKGTVLRFFGYPQAWNEMLQNLQPFNQTYSLLLENKRVVFGETIDGPIEFNSSNKKGSKKKVYPFKPTEENLNAEAEEVADVAEVEEVVEQEEVTEVEVEKPKSTSKTKKSSKAVEKDTQEVLEESSEESSSEVEDLEPEVPVKKVTRKRTKVSTPPVDAVDAVDAEEALNTLANKFPVKRGKK